MSSTEVELEKLKPIIERLCRFALIGKKLEVKGKENFVADGPNIIVGNHIGSFKDIAIVFKIVPRPVFFTANKMIFSKKDFNALVRKHLKVQLRTFGYFLDLVLNPLKSRLVNFISENIARVGTIPVDLTRQKRLAIEKCREYLKKGKAIIALQGKGRVLESDPHPYISSFRKGPSILAYNLFTEENISVAVTPVAMFGTQHPFLIPVRIRVNVGEPMYISDYLVGGFHATIENFRAAMEQKVRDLFMELIRT